jgi:FtsZ-binding cell division protein ZapB
MAEGNKQLSREERLAAKLRENLRRRKEQARAQRQPDDGLPKPQPDG